MQPNRNPASRFALVLAPPMSRRLFACAEPARGRPDAPAKIRQRMEGVCDEGGGGLRGPGGKRGAATRDKERRSAGCA